MKILEELLYTKSHEWVKFEDETTAIVGLTDYAQKELGGIVFVNLPECGDSFDVEDTFADVESVKAVSDVYLPVSGEISEVNEELLDHPELINEDPYGAWFVKVSGVAKRAELLDAGAYKAFCASEAE